MKNFAISLAVVAALTMGALSTADAQGKGRRNGAHAERHAAPQHRANRLGFRQAVDRRQARQHARIRQGRRDGSVNHRELSRLRRDQRRIDKLERRFGADGYYDRHERRVLNHKLHRSSKRIWRMKHNRRAWKRGYGKHRRFHRRFHRPHRYRHRHVYPVYPVYDSSPDYSRGLEIETQEFRFKVYGSG